MELDLKIWIQGGMGFWNPKSFEYGSGFLETQILNLKVALNLGKIGFWNSEWNLKIGFWIEIKTQSLIGRWNLGDFEK